MVQEHGGLSLVAEHLLELYPSFRLLHRPGEPPVSERMDGIRLRAHCNGGYAFCPSERADHLRGADLFGKRNAVERLCKTLTGQSFSCGSGSVRGGVLFPFPLSVSDRTRLCGDRRDFFRFLPAAALCGLWRGVFGLSAAGFCLKRLFSTTAVAVSVHDRAFCRESDEAEVFPRFLEQGLFAAQLSRTPFAGCLSGSSAAFISGVPARRVIFLAQKGGVCYTECKR